MHPRLCATPCWSWWAAQLQENHSKTFSFSFFYFFFLPFSVRLLLPFSYGPIHLCIPLFIFHPRRSPSVSSTPPDFYSIFLFFDFVFFFHPSFSPISFYLLLRWHSFFTCFCFFRHAIEFIFIYLFIFYPIDEELELSSRIHTCRSTTPNDEIGNENFLPLDIFTDREICQAHLW